MLACPASPAGQAADAPPAPSPPAAEQVEASNEVVDLEQKGRLSAALEQFLQKTNWAGQYTNHAEKLRLTLSTVTLASSLKETNCADARAVLDTLRLKLDTSSLTEIGLVIAVKLKLAEIDAAARATAEARAREMLSKADALMDKGDYKQAVTIYEHLAEQKDISPSFLIEAKTGKKRADDKEAMEKAAGSWSQQWNSVSSGLRTI